MDKEIKNDRPFDGGDRFQKKSFDFDCTTSGAYLDRQAVITHLEALGYQPREPVFLRFFNAASGGRKLEGRFPELPWTQMEQLQAERMGCYVVVNGGGQRDRDVVYGRAIFYEHDDLDQEIQRELWQSLKLPEPTLQIDTSHKSIHSYWVFTEPIAPAQWRSLQQDLLDFASADRSLKNPSRVMRLAGSIHPKTGKCSTIITHSGQRYDWETLRAIIPAAEPTTQVTQPRQRDKLLAPIQSPVPPIPLSQCLTKEHRAWLETGVSEGSRNNAGAALARDLIGTAHQLEAIGQSYASTPRSLFDQFCQRCQPPLAQPEVDQLWRSAEQAQPTPSLPDAAIAQCFQAWERQHRKAGQPQPSAHQPVLLAAPALKLPQPSVLAEAWIKTDGDRWAFNTKHQTWYCYEARESGVWSPQPDESLQGQIQQFLNSMAGANGYSWATVKAILELLKGLLHVSTWEEPIGFLPFQNGVLDLKRQELFPHAPTYRFTWSLPRAYDPNATEWPCIRAWLHEATGQDEQLQQIVLCWLNACLQGRADLQIYLHLIGPGGSGKGTLIRLATALVGKANTHASTLADWHTNRFEVANAYRKRLIVFPDEDQFKGGMGKFKSLTGGDELRAEIKHKATFSFRYQGMVMLASNFPISTDTSSGMARRTLLVPFDHPVPAAQRRNLESEFEPELAALTNHVLALSDQEVTATLLQVRSPSSKVALQSWTKRLETDSLAAWLDECVVPDLTAQTQVGNDKNNIETLFGSYWQYCDRTGSIPKSNRAFSPALLELCQHILPWNITKKSTNYGKVIVGLRLRTEQDEAIPTVLQKLEMAVTGLAVSDSGVTESVPG